MLPRSAHGVSGRYDPAGDPALREGHPVCTAVLRAHERNELDEEAGAELVRWIGQFHNWYDAWAHFRQTEPLPVRPCTDTEVAGSPYLRRTAVLSESETQPLPEDSWVAGLLRDYGQQLREMAARREERLGKQVEELAGRAPDVVLFAQPVTVVVTLPVPAAVEALQQAS